MLRDARMAGFGKLFRSGVCSRKAPVWAVYAPSCRMRLRLCKGRFLRIAAVGPRRSELPLSAYSVEKLPR